MNTNRFLTFKQVRDRTGLSRSTIWRLERAGKFPRHHRISPNRVAWDESAINEWIEKMIFSGNHESSNDAKNRNPKGDQDE